MHVARGIHESNAVLAHHVFIALCAYMQRHTVLDVNDARAHSVQYVDR
jgi:hypothetical protein